QRRVSLPDIAHLDEIGVLDLRIGDRVFLADDRDKALEQVGRELAGGGGLRLGLQVHRTFPVLGAAPRASRSLIASPRPSRGMDMTAIVPTPVASSARRCENRLAAASARSPRGDRLSVASLAGPKPSRTSPACA